MGEVVPRQVPVLQPSRVVRRELAFVSPPHPFVVLAEGWPGGLITIMSLRLPLAGAFFPPRLHRYFKLPIKTNLRKWFPLGDTFATTTFEGPVIYVVSGSLKFIRQNWPHFRGSQKLLISLEIDLKLKKEKQCRIWKEGVQFFKKKGLVVSTLKDIWCNGCTDARFLFAFGPHLSGLCTPGCVEHVERRLLSFISGGVEGRFERVSKSSLPQLPFQTTRPTWHTSTGKNGPLKYLRGEGLLPGGSPDALVACPMHKSKTDFLIRPLALEELVRVYQLPSDMDPLVLGTLDTPHLRLQAPYPFVNSASSTMFRSIMAQLWSVDTGGVKLGANVGNLGDKIDSDMSNEDDTSCSTAPTEPTNDSTTATRRECVSLPKHQSTDALLSTQQSCDPTDLTAHSSAANNNNGIRNDDGSNINNERDICSNNNVNIGSDNNSYQYTISSTACGDVGAAEVKESSTGGSGEHLSSSTPTNSGMNTQDMTAVIEEPDTTRGNLSLVMSNRINLDDSLEVNAPSGDSLVFGVGVDDVPSLFSRGGRDDPSTSSSESDGEVLADIGLGDEDSTIASASVVDEMVQSMWRKDFDEGWSIQWSTPSEMTDDSTLTSVMSSETLPTCHRQDMRVSLSSSCVDNVPCQIQVPSSPPHSSSASLQLEKHITPRDAVGGESELARLATSCRAPSLTSQGSFGVVVDKQRDALRNVKAQKEFAKATKADDAEVPVYLWNQRIDVNPEGRDKALELMRRFGHRMFRRALTNDCVAYIKDTYGPGWQSLPRKIDNNLTKLGRDLHAINHIIWHATHTNWFEYKAGSRVIHFRFPLRYRKIARDGVPVFFEEEGPTSMEPQPPIYDKEKRRKIREKIDKVMHRRYMLCTGVDIKSLIRYFGVPKGESDIRIVYDGTANHLNSKIWVPSFWLPTVDTLIRALDKNSWLADRDIGDMFLNFQLHHSVVPYTGVDLRPLYEDGEEAEPKYAHWDRNLMGIKPSPYNSIKLALIAEEVCKGDRHETGVGADGRELNPFQWKSIRLNLPGPGYDPSLSWVAKLREDSRLACELLTFVDDERIAASDEELAYQAAHVLAAKQSYLGIQDAARKWRPPSKTPGAWAGSVVYIYTDLGVCILTSEEKWAKLKLILNRYYTLLKGGAIELDHKQLLSDRGFLVYVTRNYPAMVPYLKGIHLTAEMWRGDRDEEGWKIKPGIQKKDDESVVSCQTLSTARGGGLNSSLEEDVVMDYALRRSGDKQPLYAPQDGLTPIVPRLIDDIAALRLLTESVLPPLRVVRPTGVVQVFYGFADASGTGKGFTVAGDYNCSSKLSEQRVGSDGVVYRVGVWTAKEEEESSNWKEFSNVVQSIEDEATLGKLQNCELFMFTDNAVTESCFYRGSSKSRKLHNLVLRLRLLEMRYGMVIHVIHVSGKRMIAQGTDGVSRGFLMEGVMAGDDMLSFVDLGKSALERHPPLLDWIMSWAPEGQTEVLEPEGWFETGHGITGGELDNKNVWIPTHNPSNQCFIWAPPPAAADVALEELAKARHKRTDTYHIITIPRLMAPKWRRLFNKVCDFSFVVSPSLPFWPESMYEPLWVGVILPFTHHRPWCLKRAPVLLEMGRHLRRLLEEGEAGTRDLLCKLIQLPGRIDPMPQHLASGVLHMPRRRQVPCQDD